MRLNPFEVREVLQVRQTAIRTSRTVSIPLKSGRCCKVAWEPLGFQARLNPFEVREVLQVRQIKTD